MKGFKCGSLIQKVNGTFRNRISTPPPTKRKESKTKQQQQIYIHIYGLTQYYIHSLTLDFHRWLKTTSYFANIFKSLSHFPKFFPYSIDLQITVGKFLSWSSSVHFPFFSYCLAWLCQILVPHSFAFILTVPNITFRDFMNAVFFFFLQDFRFSICEKSGRSFIFRSTE